MAILKNCLICNKKFKTYPYYIKLGQSKYCSKKCYGISLKGKIFGTPFPKDHIPWDKNKKRPDISELMKKLKIGKRPWNKDTKGVMKAWNKGKKTGYTPWLGKKRSLATNQKISKALKGKYVAEKNWNWKEDTPLRARIRTSSEYIKWRTVNFERDNYTCTACGIKGGKGKTVILQVDHYLKSFARICNENNIQTLEKALNCKELWDINNGRTLCIDCHKKTSTYLKDYKKQIVL